MLLLAVLAGVTSVRSAGSSAEPAGSSVGVAEARYGHAVDRDRSNAREHRRGSSATNSRPGSGSGTAATPPVSPAAPASPARPEPESPAGTPPVVDATTAAPAPVASGIAPAAPGAAPAGGMFPLVAPGGALPSGEECAARVQRNAWEPRPGNAQPNTTRPAGPAPYGMGSWFTSAADGPAYRGRVDGNFTGTTDEIIQWASCKWGFPTDLDRAQAVNETWWEQGFVGDGGESYGLYQMRYTTWGARSNAQVSTAFNADWAMGLRRACYDGAMWYSELRGNLEACIGVHYSGDPAESTWRSYVDSVLQHERDKTWLSWPSAAGEAPTATRR